MANEIIGNITPDYVTGTGQHYERSVYAFDLPQALLITEITIVDDFTDREAIAIAASAATIVKLTAAGVASAIVAADDLSGYRIGYQSAAGDALGTAIAENLAYWSIT